MPDEPLEFKTVAINPTLLKSVISWGWKAVLVLWFLFRVYNTQDQLSRDSAETKAKITNLETQVNQLNRDLEDERSTVKSLGTQLQDDREYYLQTRTKK